MKKMIFAAAVFAMAFAAQAKYGVPWYIYTASCGLDASPSTANVGRYRYYILTQESAEELTQLEGAITPAVLDAWLKEQSGKVPFDNVIAKIVALKAPLWYDALSETYNSGYSQYDFHNETAG